MVDIGLTHVALPVTDLARSLAFYETYTALRVIHQLGVGCATPQQVQELCEDGPPVGLWAFLRDPDGHTLELSYGQQIGLTATREQP